MKVRIPFIVERRRWRRKYMNSPWEETWNRVGTFPAKSGADAITHAQQATGAKRQDLRISGVVSSSF